MIIPHTIIFKIRILIDGFAEQFKSNILCSVSFAELFGVITKRGKVI
jgi:hypothetical protein